MNAATQRKITGALRSLSVDITDSVAVALATAFIAPIATDLSARDIVRKVKPIWYLYTKALQEIKTVSSL